MTPSTSDRSISSMITDPLEAHELACQLLDPLCHGKPGGYMVEANEGKRTIFAAAHDLNRGAIIGDKGAMIRPIKTILGALGWKFVFLDDTDKPLESPPITSWGALETVERVLEAFAPGEHQKEVGGDSGLPVLYVWLARRFGPVTCQAIGQALDYWAYPVAKSQNGVPMKVVIGLAEDEPGVTKPAGMALLAA